MFAEAFSEFRSVVFRDGFGSVGSTGSIEDNTVVELNVDLIEVELIEVELKVELILVELVVAELIVIVEVVVEVCCSGRSFASFACVKETAFEVNHIRICELGAVEKNFPSFYVVLRIKLCRLLGKL